MKQSEAAQFWPLIKAWSEGKTLQLKGVEGDWHDINNAELHFTYPPIEWRIKPEPREWYLSVDKDGYVMGARTERNEYFTVRVREVLDEN